MRLNRRIEAFLNSKVKTRSFKENLLVQFSVVGFLIMVIIAVVLATALSNKVRSDAVSAMVDETVGVASGRLLMAITPADLEVPMTGARYDKFHKFVQEYVVSERTARVKLWAKDGTVIYSDNLASVGKKFLIKETLLKALRGETATEIHISEDPENIYEKYLGTVMMEIYTPIVFPGTTEPQGAFEIYQYYEPTAQRIDGMDRWIFGSIGVGFIVLYVVLISIVWRGWRTIKQHQDTLTRVNRERWALYAVTASVSKSLELESVLHEVIRKITEIFSFDATRIFLFNPQKDELHLRASFETKPELFAQVRVFQRGEGNVGRVAETGEPIIFEDIQDNPHYQKLSQTKNTQRAGFSFFAIYPIKSKSKTLGTIVCIGQKPRHITPDENQLITSMADQIGVAAENITLFEATEARAKELSALYSVATVANQSLDLDFLLRSVMEKVLEIFEFEAASIYLLDVKDKKLRLFASNDLLRDMIPPSSFNLGQGITGKTFETGEPLFFEDIKNNLKYSQLAGKTAIREGFRSHFSMPIGVKDATVGVIHFLGKATHRFSPNEVRLIKSVANHIGIAVENTQLYEEIKKQAAQLEKEVIERRRAEQTIQLQMQHQKILHEISRAASSTLELGDMLDTVLEKLDALLPYSRILLWLYNEESGLLEPAACRNLVTKEWKKRGLPIEPTFSHMVLESKAPVRVKNLQTDPRSKFKDAFHKVGVVSYLGIPLIAKGKILGVLSFNTKEEYEFSDNEVEFVEILAREAAMAIYNSQLYETMSREALAFENMTDAVVITNRHNIIIDCNPATERIFGFSKEEVIGKTTKIFLNPDKYSDLARDVSFSLFRHGRWSGEVDIVRKDGVRGICETVIVPSHGERGKISAIIAVSRDITERKQVEMQLARSHEQLRELAKRVQIAREEERSRLAREVHDELGQALAVLKMDLAGQWDHLSQDPKLLDEGVRRVYDLIDSMVETVRRIGKTLRPSILDDLGLGAAIEWQAREFENRTGLSCQIAGLGNIVLDKDRSIAVFRIFQEILSNISRHAEANKVHIEANKESGNFLLMVTDNGKGIRREQLISSESFGIIGMRERALLCGGKVHIRGIPGNGTTVAVEIPFGEA